MSALDSSSTARAPRYLQSQSISLTQAQGVAILSEQAQLIVDLERACQLDRALEGLPDAEELAERHAPPPRSRSAPPARRRCRPRPSNAPRRRPPAGNLRPGEAAFGFTRLLRGARSLEDDHPFRKAAVEALAEDLYSHQAELTRQMAQTAPARSKAAIDDWCRQHADAFERYQLLIEDIETAGKVDLAMLTVAERELRRLAEV